MNARVRLAEDACAGEAVPIGMARLSKMAFDGEDLNPLWRQLLDRYVFEPDNAAALMDLAVVEQLFGNLEGGLARQAEAMSLRRLYRSPATASPRLRLLAFAAAADIGANTPLEFLLEGSDVALYTLYIVPGLPVPEVLPEHDLAFVAVSEGDDHRDVLAEVSALVADWPRPVVNRPECIAELGRDRAFRLLADVPGLVVPQTARIERDALAAVGAGAQTLEPWLGPERFPIIARPVGSHAGRGLAKLVTETTVAGYLAERGEDAFYISPFCDYSGADGLFRKYRVAFIDGRPYACHMAISEQWMIYYLNAGMRESAEKRAEEARFMTAFDEDFGARHAAALAEIARRVDLDYFAIDCGETKDGKLLFFEGDIAMIVHAMDPPEIYPYKGPQMRKVFDAFRAMLMRRAGRE